MPKKKAKKLKNLKNTIIASFQAKIVWKRPRKREKKIIVSLRSFLTRYRKFKKSSKKMKKKFHFCIISSQNSLEKEKERERIEIIVSFCLNLTDDLKLQKN